MRVSKIFTTCLLTAVWLTGCPSPDDDGSAADTEGSSGTSDASDSGEQTTTAGSTTTSPGGSSSSGVADDTGEDSTGEPEPMGAQCPDYEALELDALLQAGPGNATLDDADQGVLDVEFGDVDGVTTIIAVLSEDTFILVPLDETGEGPAGQVLLVDGDDVYAGAGEFEYDESTDALSFLPTTVTLEGSDATREVTACFYIGAGSSNIELEGNEATLRGALGSLTFVQIERIQQERPEIDALILADVPGSINDEVNVETGRLVRNAGWSTHIPEGGEIASGGVDMFCAGVERTMADDGRIGVHSWSDGTMDGVDYPVDSPVHDFFLEYLSEMLGDPLGPDFYWFTLQAAPAADIHWMTPEEITQYQLLTN